MPLPMGGLVTSGMGGCIYTADAGVDLTLPDLTETHAGNYPNSSDGTSPIALDVGRWHLEPIYGTSECPHSGSAGAIARRYTYFDFRFSLEIPYDYNTPPDQLFIGTLIACAIRFNLADVAQEPELSIHKPVQQYYLAPSALVERAPFVLNAVGDVMRMQVMGSGNGLLFHMPHEQEKYDAYKTNMESRGWLF